MSLAYRLVVLTHGDEPKCAVTTLDSFGEMVKPLPAETIVVRDGPGYSYVPRWAGEWRCVQAAIEQIGFCAATRHAWALAASSGPEYVFWLEHDFEFLRPVDLRELAAVLDANPQLAQMALMRGAVNATERAAGGLFESRPGQYELRHTIARDASGTGDSWTVPWLEHRAYLTTNPSLMRRGFMRANPWPDPKLIDSNCEGKFGIQLVEAGHSFGVWGSGEPWCKHIGTRTGFGY